MAAAVALAGHRLRLCCTKATCAAATYGMLWLLACHHRQLLHPLPQQRDTPPAAGALHTLAPLSLCPCLPLAPLSLCPCLPLAPLSLCPCLPLAPLSLCPACALPRRVDNSSSYMVCSPSGTGLTLAEQFITVAPQPPLANSFLLLSRLTGQYCK
jgi:hypothetical protein